MRAPFHRLTTLGWLAGTLCLAVPLASCGFSPMYAQKGLTLNMAQVDIQAPQTRTGYFLEQDLKNGFGDDPQTAKLYSLKIKMTEQHFSIGYKVDDTATRSEITNTVAYELVENETGKVLCKDTFTNTVTYESSTSPFTGVVSQQDGQVRMASSVAEKIQTAIALYFHDKQA